MKILSTLMILTFLIQSSYALSFYKKMHITSANVTYNLKFLLKNIKGTSKNVRGKGVCSKKCKFLIATPHMDDHISTK